MQMPKVALYTAGVFFAAGAIAHIVRLIVGIQIVVGDVVVPLWGSLPGAFVAALIAVWMTVAARRV